MCECISILALYWFHALGLLQYWTTKFRSQRTSHMESSATGTIRSPELSESAFKRTLKTHLFSTARRH